jgi:hypothetical protein
MRRVKTYTADELVELIDRSLKQTARDVREGRIPLDGRARLLLPEQKGARNKSALAGAAE